MIETTIMKYQFCMKTIYTEKSAKNFYLQKITKTYKFIQTVFFI